MRNFAKWIMVVLLCMIWLVLGTGCKDDSRTAIVTDAPSTADADAASTTDASAVSTTSESVGSETGKGIPTFSKALLLEDFDQFVNIIEITHPKLYTDKAALANLIASTRDKIQEDMTELEFYRLLSPVATLLNCGHSNVSLSSETEDALFQQEVMFPLFLHWVGNRAYVTQNACADTIPIGTEILSINGRPMTEIYTTLLANLPADGMNQTRKHALMNLIFNYYYTLVVEDTSTFEVAYDSTPDIDDNTHSATLDGVTSTVFYDLTEAGWADAETPFTSAFADDYATITFNTFYPQGAFTLSDYKTFMDDFFKEVKDKGIQNLILDVRGNSGGDPYVTSHLFSYLAKTSQPYFVDRGVGYYTRLYDDVPLAENRFSGKLAILMDGMSFSSTGHLLALLKYQDLGTFFGEESGASYACTDATQSFTLRNTKVNFYSSTIIWEAKAEGLTPGRGIMPDYLISQTLKQYLEGDDVVMKAAVKWLKED